MESHRVGKDVQLEMETLNGASAPERSPAEKRSCLKCGVFLASLMGLVAVTTLLLFFFVFWPSCEQDAGAAHATGKVNVTCKLQVTDQKGQYAVFTAEKSGKYLIYGWLRRPTNTSEEVRLVHTYKATDRPLRKNTNAENVLFFHTEALLMNTSRISLQFMSPYTDSYFYVNEL